VCRMHGARRPTNIKKGPEHPNYKHGKETIEARLERSQKAKEFHRLVNFGNASGLFNVTVKLRGRPAKI
jgi:hypothetical protein